jgi:hypothetical protein
VCDQAAGKFEERFVDVGSAFPAGPQTSEAMQPREASLDHPAVGAQSGAVPCSAAGDGRHDVASADLISVDVVVVPTVGEERVGLAARSSDPAADRRIASSKGRSWVTSLRLPPVSRTASGVPCPSVMRWCFEPARPRSTGEGPVWLPLLAP